MTVETNNIKILPKAAIRILWIIIKQAQIRGHMIGLKKARKKNRKWQSNKKNY